MSASHHRELSAELVARSSRRKSSAAFIIHKQKKAAAEQQLGALLQPRGWAYPCFKWFAVVIAL